MFIDKRIAQTSIKISDDEKMRMRYLREQRDRLREKTHISRKRQKFNLDDDEENYGSNKLFMGFTHKGKKLEELDDF